MSDRRAIPPNITFHEGASEEFRNTVLEAYNAVPAIIRQRLHSFSGSQTLIRTAGEPFARQDWMGLSVPPTMQRYRPLTLPIEDRTLLRLGRHQLTVAERYPGTGIPFLLPSVSATLHHEIGHRIDRAISGDNYTHGEMTFAERPDATTFSRSQLFLDAIRQDLADAGWPPPPAQPPPPGLRIDPSLLPRPDASGQLNWRGVAGEIFAELYRSRFSTTRPPLSYYGEEYRTDFSIFRRAGLLVDRAVATFAGQPVVPLNPNPGDYPPGQHPVSLSGPTILQRAVGLVTGTDHFRPIGPDALHPPPPRPPGPRP